MSADSSPTPGVCWWWIQSDYQSQRYKVNRGYLVSMLQLTHAIDITSKPFFFFLHFVDDVDLNAAFQFCCLWWSQNVVFCFFFVLFLFLLLFIYLFIFFFLFTSFHVRKQNCKIKSSGNKFLSHLFLSLPANIFACNPLSSWKTTLFLRSWSCTR